MFFFFLDFIAFKIFFLIIKIINFSTKYTLKNDLRLIEYILVFFNI